MSIDDWFWPWAKRHVERFPRGDWPGPEKEFWSDLRHLLVKSGATEAIADEASRRLFTDPPGFPDAHPKAIRDTVKALFRERAAKAPTPGVAPPEEDTTAWNAAAAVHWASLNDDEREAWRDMVRKRCSFLVRSKVALDWTAAGWAYDPSWIISLPPKQDPAPPGGPRRVFDASPSPNPNPKG